MIPNPANYSAISFPLLGIEVDPIRTISLGPLTIHLYGAVIALGLLLAGIYCSHRSKRAGLTEDDILDGILPGMRGRIAFWLYYWLLSKKINPMVLIVATMVVGIIGAFFGVLA